jgi:serine/threonine protein kinase/WD40 repeat protein
MSVDAKRVQAAFLAALEAADPVERAAILDRECASDLELRRRVEALLHAHDNPASILGRPAARLECGGAAGENASTPWQHLATYTQEMGGAAGPGGSREAVDPLELSFLEPSPKPGVLGRLGHYEVLEVLGRGGFGIVLRALDEALQRVVAVKVLAPQMAATSPARKRFLREARSYAAIRHENVVQVHAVEEQPLPYLVMEFIPGGTLQQMLDRTGPLEVPEVLCIGRQIAEGLAAAHAIGLIHRDVKPSNVLIEGGPQRRVKLTDFGLARAADDASLTQSGLVAGTPLYMAPEQARGETLDHRADLFSLGSVLYVMCSGRPPFRANGTLAILKRVSEDTPRPIREIIPETPPWLCDLIARLHAKAPAERFQSAGEVVELLRRYEAEPADDGKAVSAPPHPARPKRAAGMALLAAAGVVLVGVLVCALMRWSPAGSGEPPGDPSPTASWQPKPPPTREELARRSSPFDALDRKDLSKDVLVRLFGGADKAPPELVTVFEGHPFRLPRPGRTSWFAQDPKGQWLAVPCETAVVVFDPRGMAPAKVLGAAAGRVYHAAFSPDGKRLAIACWSDEDGAAVWDVATGEPTLKLQHPGGCWSIQFSPDGARLLTVSDDHIPIVWDAQSGAELHRFPAQEQPVCGDVTFTADGKQVVTHTDGGAVTVWDATTWKEVITLAGPERVTEKLPDWLHCPLAVSSDGRWLAAGSPSGLKVWATATWKEQISVATPATWLAFAPDGDTILTGPHEGAEQQQHAVARWDTRTGRWLKSATLSSRGPWAVYHLSTDGKTLYAMVCDPAEAAVHVYDADTLEERIPPGHIGRVCSVDVSPDGASIASAGADGTVRLWDVGTRRLRHVIPRPGKVGTQVVFSPDGKTLYAAWSEDGVTLAVDPTTGGWRELGVYGPQLQRLAAAPDATLLAAAGEGGVRTWALPDGLPRGEAPGDRGAAGAIGFSPDAKTLAIGGQGFLRLFEVATGRLVSTFEFPGTVRWVGFRPGGRSLAAVGEGAAGSGLLFDLAASARVLRLEGDGNPLLSGAWRADGGLLAAVGATESTVQLWDFAHPLPKRCVVAAAALNVPGIEAVAFSPDGRHLVTAHADGTISVLRLANAGEAFRVP